MSFIAGFLMGQMFGKRKVASSNEPLPIPSETLKRHKRIANYIKNNPFKTNQEISKAMGESVSDTNASLLVLMRREGLQRTIDKRYFFS